jgi:hypothetical protein
LMLASIFLFNCGLEAASISTRYHDVFNKAACKGLFS